MIFRALRNFVVKIDSVARLSCDQTRISVSDSDEPQTLPSGDRIEQLDAAWPKIAADVGPLLRAKLKSKEDADDATHEAYMRIRNHADPAIIRNLSGFAYIVARNVATDRLRERSRHLRLDGQPDVEQQLQRDFDERRSPEGIYAEQEKREVLARALEQLPARIKLVCEAHLDGQDVKSIAERLGIKLHTVYRDLRDAHELLAAIAMRMRGERNNE
jgi:RNA polymerase sigma-70 factor (ECF subfamily)